VLALWCALCRKGIMANSLRARGSCADAHAVHSKAANELEDKGANAIANSSLSELELGSES